jgi:hypothetical protein
MPSIPEVDNAPVSSKNAFMQFIESKFGDQLGTYKSGLLSSLSDKVNPSSYLSMFGM